VAAPRVDFYVGSAGGGDARLRLACRLVEKAWQSRQPVLVYSGDAALLERCDALLWTFAEDSFIPHERLDASVDTGRDAAAAASLPATPRPGEPAAAILLATMLPPAVPRELLLNLDPAVPAFAAEFARIIEVLDDDPRTRELGRERFRAYRRLGAEPATHTVNSGQPGRAAPL
jgi:DNA polymerase-3 subunit chi